MFSLRSRTLSRWFENDLAFWKLFTCLLAFFAVLKGIRRPGLWALTQAELDYSSGFIKRGLLGELFHALHLWRWHQLEAAFALELALFFGVLTLLTFRSGLLRQLSGWYLAAVFASSYCVTFLVHLIGYTDIANAAMAMALLLLRDTRLRFLIALPVITIAVLVHENFLLLFAPVVLFSFFLDGCSDAPEIQRKAWIRGIILGGLAVILALATSLKQNLTPGQAQLMQSRMSTLADFPLRADVFAVLTLSFRNNLATMWKMYAHSYWWWAEQLLSVCVFGPVMCILIHRCYRTLSSVAKGTRLIKSAVLVSAFAPLAMHLLGWDQVRWNALCVLDAYLCLLAINLRFGAPHIQTSNAERNLVILVIAVNMASGYGLTDYILVKSYPFFPPAIKGIVARHDGFTAPL